MEVEGLEVLIGLSFDPSDDDVFCAIVGVFFTKLFWGVLDIELS